MTPAEAILWHHPRGRRFGGVKFRRQQPVGPYIADFLCARLKLVIELDGDSHVGREVKDLARQEWLKQEGYRVVRYINPDIYDDLDTVLNDIWSVVDAAMRVAG